jgi:uncharacterized cupredoxin-like copper-binding protein
MRRLPRFPLLFVLMTVVLAGCTPRGATSPSAALVAASPVPQAGVSASPAAPPSGSMQVIAVTLRDFAIEPRTIKARPGRLQFRITNQGAVEHDFHIPAVETHRAHAQHLVKPGETRTLEYRLKPGRYEVVCTIPGHREAGMTATLEVAP